MNIGSTVKNSLITFCILHVNKKYACVAMIFFFYFDVKNIVGPCCLIQAEFTEGDCESMEMSFNAVAVSSTDCVVLAICVSTVKVKK